MVRLWSPWVSEWTWKATNSVSISVTTITSSSSSSSSRLRGEGHWCLCVALEAIRRDRWKHFTAAHGLVITWGGRAVVENSPSLLLSTHAVNDQRNELENEWMTESMNEWMRRSFFAQGTVEWTRAFNVIISDSVCDDTADVTALFLPAIFMTIRPCIRQDSASRLVSRRNGR